MSSLEHVLQYLLHHRDLGRLKRDATTPSEFQAAKPRYILALPIPRRRALSTERTPSAFSIQASAKRGLRTDFVTRDANQLATLMSTVRQTSRRNQKEACKCVNGKPCGNSCIAEDKICHK